MALSRILAPAALAATFVAAACSGTTFSGDAKDDAGKKPAGTDTSKSGTPGTAGTSGKGDKDGNDGTPTGGGEKSDKDDKDGGDKNGNMLDGNAEAGGDGDQEADEDTAKDADKDGKDGKDGEPQIDLGEATKKPCVINVGYDPQSVRCNLPISGPNIWTATGGWKENVALFTDKSAAWISPLGAQSGDDGPFCPRVPQNEKLIYVSHFKVATAGPHTVEVLNDNTGAVRLWRAADPAQEKLAHPTSNGHSPATVNLAKGHYAIVVDGQDFGVASAIVLSIKANGQVVKRSTSDGSWCIFRVPAATNVADYVPKAASCRPCFTGP